MNDVNQSLDQCHGGQKQRIRPHSAILIISAVILCLPDLHVVDLLPDVIAYGMLLYILSPYAIIDSHIAQAQRYMEHMLMISVAQLLSIPLILVFLAPSPQEQPTFILLTCFVFAFFRIKTVFPLTKELGEGLLYLDMRNDGNMFCAPHKKKIRRKAGKARVRLYSYSVTDRMMRATRTFVLATSILNTLPEFAALSYDPTNIAGGMYKFISLLRGFSMIVSLGFGIVFLCRVVSFAKNTREDKAYYARLDALYAHDEKNHPERKTQKYLRRTFFLITLFAVFTMDFTVDKINVLPDFVGALLLLVAFVLLRRYISGVGKRILLTIGYFATSVSHYMVSTMFFMRYHPESILRSTRIRLEYLPVQILSVVEAVFLAAVMLSLFRTLFSIIGGYTGYEIEGTANYSREEKLREEHHQQQRSLIPAMVAAFATVLAGPLYVFLRPTVEFVWVFSVIIPAVFAVLLTNSMMRLRDSVDNRFMLR